VLRRLEGRSTLPINRFRAGAGARSHTPPDRIAGLIGYAREKFAAAYPFAPALRPIREVLAKLAPAPKPEPLSPRKPYVPSLVLQQKNKWR
jgi:hypothetical protein